VPSTILKRKNSAYRFGGFWAHSTPYSSEKAGLLPLIDTELSRAAGETARQTWGRNSAGAPARFREVDRNTSTISDIFCRALTRCQPQAIGIRLSLNLELSRGVRPHGTATTCAPDTAFMKAPGAFTRWTSRLNVGVTDSKQLSRSLTGPLTVDAFTRCGTNFTSCREVWAGQEGRRRRRAPNSPGRRGFTQPRFGNTNSLFHAGSPTSPSHAFTETPTSPGCTGRYCCCAAFTLTGQTGRAADHCLCARFHATPRSETTAGISHCSAAFTQLELLSRYATAASMMPRFPAARHRSALSRPPLVRLQCGAYE
jgi:hypothetical protein